MDPNALNSNPDPEYRYWPNFDSDQDPGLPGTYLEKKREFIFKILEKKVFLFQKSMFKFKTIGK